MSLANGAKAGSYEIIAPLGAGGMREVYRAKDTKLKRDVALKVLPEGLPAAGTVCPLSARGRSAGVRQPSQHRADGVEETR